MHVYVFASGPHKSKNDLKQLSARKTDSNLAPDELPGLPMGLL